MTSINKIELINGEFVVDWIEGCKLGFKSLKDAMLFLLQDEQTF